MTKEQFATYDRMVAAVQQLNALCSDPQPGLTTWLEMLHKSKSDCVNAILAFEPLKSSAPSEIAHNTNAASQMPVAGDSMANAEADSSRGTTRLSNSATSEDKFATSANAASSVSSVPSATPMFPFEAIGLVIAIKDGEPLPRFEREIPAGEHILYITRKGKP